MKTVIEMAHKTLERMKADEHCREQYWSATDDELQAFAELVRADERNSWPLEMEAMERQVNILTDALALAKADERNRLADKLQQDFKGAFGQDTCSSWASWLRSQK